MSISKGIQGLMVGFALAATILATPVSSDAMEIKQFDKMSLKDRGRYVGELMGQSVRYLWAHGKKEAGEKVLDLFRRSNADKAAGKISPGMQAFADTLNILRAAEKAGKLNATPHAEHAMFVMLKKHGITIPPKEIMFFAKDFKPQDKRFANNATPPSVDSAATPK